jgi:uncharacterized membrane protein|tara:strand:- start:189 stop:455 length:267 start_codon:yes stop_codon:yes gene_type:complete
MNDLLFGLIDNGVLAFCAVLGINLDEKFKYGKVNGALYGGLFGNSLSDFLAGLGAYDFFTSFKITIGCLIVVPIVWAYYKYINNAHSF